MINLTYLAFVCVNLSTWWYSMPQTNELNIPKRKKSYKESNRNNHMKDLNSIVGKSLVNKNNWCTKGIQIFFSKDNLLFRVLCM